MAAKKSATAAKTAKARALKAPKTYDTRKARNRQLAKILEGHKVRPVPLPYTPYELRRLPVRHIVTTAYWQSAHASVGLRGVERIVHWHELVPGASHTA